MTIGRGYGSMTDDSRRVTREATPCWCYGPWQQVAPEERPDTTLGRQHEQGSAGCEYPRPIKRDVPVSRWPR